MSFKSLIAKGLNACSPPSLSSSCNYHQIDRTLMLLNAYDEEAQVFRKESKKCANIAQDQWTREATYVTKGFFVNALEEINKGLCFAPNDTDSLGIFYSNRAHVLADMDLYSEALRSLQLATDNHYPSCKLHEIESKREIYKQKLEQMGGNQKEHKFRMSLSHPACPRNPSVISDIHVANNSTYGRHLIADRDLEVGDVICIEEAYVKCIQPQQRYKRCTHCLAEVPHLLIPCTGCTNAMFCCIRCRDKAWDVYHQHECAISEELMDLEQDVCRLAIRIFFVVIRLFRNKISDLQSFLKSNKNNKITAFDLDHTNLCAKQQFMAYYNGHCADAHLSEALKENNLRQSAVLASLIGTGENSTFKKQLSCDKLKVFLMELLYHFICLNWNNSFEVGSPSMSSQETVPTCLAIFPCMSLASHSCSGNVTRVRYGMKEMWVVTHFIAQGAQIFDNYGSFFMNQPLEERQSRLFQHYGFECKCEACEFDYPLARELTEPLELPYPEPSFITEHAPLTVAKLKAELTAVKGFIMKYDDSHFPCKQLRKAEMRLVHLFRAAVKDFTLETKYPEFTTHEKYEELVDNDECPWASVAEDVKVE